MSGVRPDAVVKVGGSLFDLPDLGQRLRRFLEQTGWQQVLLVPGGGPTADAVRMLDRCHQLGEEASHWLALEAMALNARFLAHILSDPWMVVNALHFAEADEGKPGSLPHFWSVTSDSVAARVAVVVGARRLVLLKSADIAPELSWTEASRRGLVDAYFPQILSAAADLEVSAVNLRTWAG